MKKTLLNIIFFLYLIIAIFVTVCLLSYNDYKVTVFGDTSFVIVTDNKMNPDFNKGDLVLVEDKGELAVGEKAFFYNVYNQTVGVKLGTVSKVDKVNDENITYTIDDTYEAESTSILGSANGVKVYSNLGTVLNILESRWGFLFLIVLPALLAFVNQLIVVISGIKENKEN